MMQKMRNKNIWLGVLASLGTYGICYLLDLAGTVRSAYSIFTLLLPVGIYWMLQQTIQNLELQKDTKERGRRMRYAALISLVFAVSMIMGYQLQQYGMTESGVKAKLLILLRGACLSIPVIPFVNGVLWKLESLSGRTEEARQKTWSSGKLFLVSLIVIFLCWIPVFLAYYPIVMSYDFHRQVNEAAKSFAWFNSYQPLIHTLMIWVFLQLGRAVHSLEFGMGCLTLLQMLIVAVALAYACTMIYRIVKKKWVVYGLYAFYGLFPFVSISTQIGSKDAIFGALMMIFLLLLLERQYFVSAKNKWKIEVTMLLVGVLMMMFRYNAWYAMILFGIAFVLCSKGKERVRVLVLCLALIIGGKGAQEGIQHGLGTNLRGSDAEKYSVIIQQFARVGHYHESDMDPETYATVEKYVSKYGWDKYLPGLTDSARSGVTYAVYWEPDLKQVFVDWVKIGLKYPNEYIDAFLYLTSGYWFWDDVSYCETQGSGLEERKGAIYTNNSSASDEFEGIQHISKFPWLEEQLEQIVSANAFYEWPIISNLFKASTYCWLMMLTIVALLYVHKKKYLLICAYPLLYFGTMLLGPAVQFRYAFPIMIVVPLLASLLFLKTEEGEPRS